MTRRLALAAAGPLLLLGCALWAPFAGRINLAEAAPFVGHYRPRVGLGTPLALLVAVVVVTLGPGLAQRLPWRALRWSAWAVSLAWTVSLALVDGSAGLRAPLTSPDEYLADLPRVHGLHGFLQHFTEHVHSYATGPRWVTDVSGHPPGLLLVFAGLREVGLSGPWPAALLCVAVGASAPAAALVALGSVGGEPAARRAAPFLVLLPAAVWVAVSGDAFFLGVSAWGVALLARGGLRSAAAGGALLGFSLLLSYGLVTLGLVPLVVLALRRDLRHALVAAGSAVAVLLAPAALGFRWWVGLHETLLRYRGGAGGYRPYGYFLVADLALLAVAVGPAVLAGLGELRRDRASLLVLAALGGVLVADLTGDSKGEVERIWLFFTPWLALAAARLPRARLWLSVQAATALAVQSLLLSKW